MDKAISLARLPRIAGKKNKGVAILELVIVLPILLTIIFVSIELFWYFHVKQTMFLAAREGARVYVVEDDQALAEDAVRMYLQAHNLDVPSLVIMTDPPGFDPQFPSLLHVSVSAKYKDVLLMENVYGLFTDDSLVVKTYMSR